jgi:leader peptidase (prepilin peptidase)/N-methyltransferase
MDGMDGWFIGLVGVFVFVLGTAVGSFLNVVIYRIPAGLSLLHPPSRCPKCMQRLKPYDNVPVLGWLWLCGRCRYCKTRISIRYPLVEAATGLLFVWAYWAFQVPLPAIGYWAFLSWLLALALIDLDTMTLPNPLTQTGLITGFLFQGIVGWSVHQSIAGVASQLWVGVLGAIVGIWLFDLITIAGSIVFGQTAMGGGDAKLAAMIGVWLGWQYILLAAFLACALGAFIGGGAIAVGLLNRRQPMPFGPFLALGATIAVFWGEAIVSGYLRFFFAVG